MRWIRYLALQLPLLAGCGTVVARAPLSSTTFQAGACRIAAQSGQPLVTEWSASEKAHLQGKLASGGVVVSYSGCELTILEECSVEGNYEFVPTTPSSDRIEIRSRDELYAKLPLGAASLEGELKQTDHVAVETTVSGQEVLRAERSDVLAGGPACEGATHVVQRISVGAYQLLSTGSQSAKGQAAFLGAEAGGGVQRDERVLRAAGDRASCNADPTGEGASVDPNCRSPLQVFLTPLPVPKPKPGTDVHFTSDDEGERWLLREREGAVVCELPCLERVDTERSLYVQRESDTATDVERIDVPRRFPYDASTPVEIVAYGTRGNRAVPTIMAGVGVLGVNIGGAATIGVCSNEGGEACAVTATIAGTSALLLAAGLLWGLGYNRAAPDLEVRKWSPH